MRFYSLLKNRLQGKRVHASLSHLRNGHTSAIGKRKQQQQPKRKTRTTHTENHNFKIDIQWMFLSVRATKLKELVIEL